MKLFTEIIVSATDENKCWQLFPTLDRTKGYSVWLVYTNEEKPLLIQYMSISNEILQPIPKNNFEYWVSRIKPYHYNTLLCLVTLYEWLVDDPDCLETFLFGAVAETFNEDEADILASTNGFPLYYEQLTDLFQLVFGVDEKTATKYTDRWNAQNNEFTEETKRVFLSCGKSLFNYLQKYGFHYALPACHEKTIPLMQYLQSVK